MRQLGDEFVEDLEQGCLSGLLKMVVSDTSLCLELRGSAVHVYYRGGRLMAVERERNSYSFSFNDEYFEDGESIDLDANDVSAWLEAVPRLKHAVDLHLGEHAKDEREFQQVLLRENNFGRIARSTDYYICDIEHAVSVGGKRRQFDLIAAHWPSGARKFATGRRLVFIEMKYGDDALRGDAGIRSHLEDVNRFLEDQESLGRLKEDMVEVFNQKRQLGLIDCDKNLQSFGNRPHVLLVLANHDPGSSRLNTELSGLRQDLTRSCDIATASFMGYGLYDQGVHSLDRARDRFRDYMRKPRY